MPNGDPTKSNHSQEPHVKRFRSVREYRDQKKLQKLNGSNSTGSNVVSSGDKDVSDAKDSFVKLLKDTVAVLCYNRLSDHDSAEDITPDFVPEWRTVCRIISQTLLDKEARMPANVRYNLSDPKMVEGTVRRIRTYTSDYLERKYPR